LAIVYFKCLLLHRIKYFSINTDEISGTESHAFLCNPDVGEIESAMIQYVGTDCIRIKRARPSALSFLSILAGSKEDGLSLSEMPCPLSLGSHAAPGCFFAVSGLIFCEYHNGMRGGIIPPQPRVTLHHERPRGLLIRLPLSNAIRDAKSRSLVMHRCWGLREKILRVPPQHFLL